MDQEQLKITKQANSCNHNVIITVKATKLQNSTGCLLQLFGSEHSDLYP